MLWFLYNICNTKSLFQLEKSAKQIGMTDSVFNENTNNPSPVIILFAYFTRHSFCASYFPAQ